MSGSTTNDDILQGLNQLIKAVNDLVIPMGQNQGGGCGPVSTDCLGDPDGSVVDTDPSSDQGDPEVDDPPDGFDSWEDYFVYKCKAANMLIDACEWFFRFLGFQNAAAVGITAGAAFGAWLLGQIGAALAAASIATTAGGFTVTTALTAAFTALFMSSAPAWVLGLIVAAIASVTVTAGVGFLIVFDAMADDFAAKKNDLVCQLFVSETVEEARDVLSTALSDSAASFVIDAPYDAFEAAIRAVTSTIISWMLPNSVLNRLFEASDLVEGYTVETVDCGMCVECPVLYDGDQSDWSNWTNEDNSTNSGSSVGTNVDGLQFEIIIAASPSGLTSARRDFVAPLSEILSGGWSPSTNAIIKVHTLGSSPAIVGYAAIIDYETDPQQVTSLGSGSGPTDMSFSPNSDDTIVSITINVGNTRTSGSGTSDNTGEIDRVEFCNF